MKIERYFDLEIDFNHEMNISIEITCAPVPNTPRHIFLYSYKSILTTMLIVIAVNHSAKLSAQIADVLSAGTASVSFNLRYESVEQDNSLDNAQALTLSSKFSYTTGTVNGFFAMVEVEDVRIVLGVDEYTVGPTGFNQGKYSVIADPETTELDQGFLQYSSDNFTAKIGRQVMVYDNHRFVGEVGWRQDRQTFDALSLTFTPIRDLNLSYNYLDERRRIFSEDADIDSKDHLLHANYKTSIGTLTAYAYLLEMDNNTDNSLDTYGLRLSGSREVRGLDTSYLVEYASQESETGLAKFDADYLLLEGGLTVNAVTAKIGYEVLGSDDGAYGFSTPLSTLHAHNGWADLFLGTPSQGLVDTYLNLSGKVWNGNWSVIYHNFDADDSATAIDDFGNELDLQFLYPISDSYMLGIKYAKYFDVDVAAGKPGTDKFWLWFTARF